jgi:hypothetical protein
MVGDAVCQR